MKKILTALFTVGALLLASCQSKDIDNVQTQIDELQGQINPISTQITNINSTIKTLQETDATIQAAVKDLQEKMAKIDITAAESEINKLKTRVDALEAMDIELQKQINTLRSYVDTQLGSIKDWANASFATLAKFNELSDVVTGISSKVSTLENDLAKTKLDIKSDYTQAIKDAISKNETSMKQWVAEQLTDYYTIAQTDASLKELAESADSAMRSEIGILRGELTQAKSDITDAYQKAIGTAISELEGRINDKIAKDIQTAKNALQGQIDTINGEIKDIKSRISALEGSVNTIEGQIVAINKSITELEKTDKELQGYINILQGKLGDLEKDVEANAGDIKTLKGNIEDLKLEDEKLQKQISDLKTYVDTELGKITNWAEATFATLEKFDSLCKVVAAIPATVEKVAKDLAQAKIDIKSEYTQAIKDAVDKSESSMKQWVNEALTGYWTIAEVQARLDTLKGDTQDVRNELAKVKEELTKEYKGLIEKAVNETNGKIGDLQEQINAITGVSVKLTELVKKVNELEKEYAALKADIEAVINRIQSIVAVPTYTDGSVMILGEGADNITFDVLPLTTIDTLVRAGGVDIFSFNVVKTITKSGTEARSIKVSSAAINSVGQLVLTVDASELGDDFFGDEAALSASLAINTKLTSKSSSYFPLYAYHIKLYTDRTTTRQL